MSTPQPTKTTASDQRVFVPIPKAGPGQGYRAPKNHANPLLSGAGALAIVAMCASLPLAPAAIFTMILVYSQAIALGFLPLWLLMIVLIESIAIFLAVGLAREALGISSRADYPQRARR